jgi:hypothetical protein
LKNRNSLRPGRVCAPFILAALLLGAGAVAQDGKRVAVGRMTGKISLDGVLDEAEWAGASSLGAILQREPKQEVAATERTEVKLLADKDNLYIGVMCYDSEPEKVVGAQMARDADLEIDDSVAILLDTFHDRRNAFYFATNPAGALVDGLIIENQRTINFNWNAIWNARVKRTAQGWSAEFAIPFKSLSFNPGQDVWGFNFSRVIVRKLEEDRWATPRLDVEFTQVSEAGEIAGFAEVEQGRGLDVRPFAARRWIRDERGANRFEGDVGGDIFYNGQKLFRRALQTEPLQTVLHRWHLHRRRSAQPGVGSHARRGCSVGDGEFSWRQTQLRCGRLRRQNLARRSDR